jgi:Ras-related protein Rab-4B
MSVRLRYPEEYHEGERERSGAAANVNTTGRVLSSQTIGVEFSSKIVHIADRKSSAHSRKRIKLQLWDTAGTERFRSVSRSYYRGAAGAILVYDVSSWRSFEQLQTFLNDARALAGPDITIILAGNKSDVVDGPDMAPPPATPSSMSSLSAGLHARYTVAPDGREVPYETASRWASDNGIPVAVEVSALSGDNVDELFNRLARMILTKIEVGEIDPDDPASGIQYGDLGFGWDDGGGSIRSTGGDEGVRRRVGMKKARNEWDEVFRLGNGRRKRGCC